jgi:hypothetical protein
LKYFKRLRSNQIFTLDEKDRLSPDSGLQANLVLSQNQVEMALLVDASVKINRIQSGIGGKLFDRYPNVTPPPDSLILKQDVMKFPETTLVSRALCGLVRLVGAIAMIQNRGKDQGNLAGFDIIFSNNRLNA